MCQVLSLELAEDRKRKPSARLRCVGVRYHWAGSNSFSTLCDSKRDSLKSVLPALLPGEGYIGLEIADGIKALVAYTKLLDGEIPTGQQAAVRTDLLDYCGYDTEALVKIYQKLGGDA